SFRIQPQGPFDLSEQRQRFGGWPAHPNEPLAPVIAFPIEGTDTAAAVVVRQHDDGTILGDVHCCAPWLCAAAQGQALATLSLDVDGSGWPEVGSCDPRLGELQARYRMLRPVLFHSPYEAAAAFIIGHRISIPQARAIREWIAIAHGARVEVDGHSFHTFPAPSALLAITDLDGVPSIKLARLHAVAWAAKDGWLSREHLLGMPVADALRCLQELPGIGPFFAQGILFRGAGLVDELTDDDVTRYALAVRYSLPEPAAPSAVQAITDSWRPYRMWAVVLLHTWLRSEIGLPPRTASGRSH
ncbi:MAG: DNA-3-methyladenine glycosylase 2 family protein, partial [Acidimicrobiales bacterium]